MFLFFASDDTYKDAIILNLISEWTKKSEIPLGRTIIQKLCYFAEAIDIPLGYRFSVYQYGPYSQELYMHIDDMVINGLINDENMSNKLKAGTSVYSLSESAKHLLEVSSEKLEKIKDSVSFLIDYLKKYSPRDLELMSTTHYYYTANKNYYGELDDAELKALTIRRVIEAKKDKFSQFEIDNAYLLLKSTAQFH